MFFFYSGSQDYSVDLEGSEFGEDPAPKMQIGFIKLVVQENELKKIGEDRNLLKHCY